MKKTRITGIVFLTLFAAGLSPTGARAAAPLSITSAGIPRKWDNSKPIMISFDLGPYRTLSNSAPDQVDAKGQQLILKAFQQWTSIDTAKISVAANTVTPDLGQDVNGSNVISYLNGVPSDVNPIIFDADGSVTEAVFGNSASLNVLASALDLTAGSDQAKGLITQAGVILNGRAQDGLFDPDDVTDSDLTRAAAFAAGQFLGVGLSDTNDELIFDGNVANNNAVPIMHPFTPSGLVIGGGFVPTLDDRMAISALYPSATFSTNTGTIAGQLFFPDGTTGAQGFGVVARKVDDPVNSAVSAITGITFRNPSGSGMADPSLRGSYSLNVPPGNYTLEFRPLLELGLLPFGGIFPLPGGSQFYQGSSTPAPTGTAGPATATPITVTAGKTVQINFTAVGKPAPAPQAVAQVKPDDAPANAQLLPLSAKVSGTVSPKDPGQIVLNLGLDPGGSGKIVEDKIENLYRIVVPEESLLTLYLQPKDKVNLRLYLLAGILGSAAPLVVDAALATDTSAKVLQDTLPPGTYIIGVSVADDQTVGSDYTLSFAATPTSQPPAQPLPVLDQVMVGNVTDTGAQVSWISDLDTTADAIVGMPDQQFGDPMPGKAHRLPITGLTASSDADLQVFAQVPGGFVNNLPFIFFHTADTSAATGAPNIQAFVVGTRVNTIGTADAPQDTVLVDLALQNRGGPASNVQITALAASPGWKLANPVSQPLSVGGIGSNATAIVLVRLLRDGTGPAPLATVTGTGTLAGTGAATTFTINGP